MSDAALPPEPQVLEELQPELLAPSKPIGRRVFLGLTAAGLVSLALGSEANHALDKTVGKVTAKVPGLRDIVPIGDRFRIYTVTDGYPHRSHTAYRLSITGLVDRPLTLSYTDLQRRTATHLTKDFQCVTGWRVADVKWTGVLLRDLLDEAGAHPHAALRFTSFDGIYTESLTMAQARRDDVIVAYQMLGSDISDEHGGPVRLYVAPMYGYKSCKWLSGIKVVDGVEPGYWEQYGYDVDAWVGRSNGRNDDATS